MSNPDLALIQYLTLATISQSRQQSAGCDRFLILAGIAACGAGWLDVAEACRRQVLQHNPHHLLSRWATLPDAIRSRDFSSFQRQLERFCGVERAETLLSELKVSIALEDGSAKDQAWTILEEILGDPSLNEVREPGEIEKTA